MSNWMAQVARHYERALPEGLPRFNGCGERSTPFNAAPYLVSYQRFCEQASAWPGRQPLLQCLQDCLCEARAEDLVIDALLLGGSFLDRHNPAPRDIDCVWLYRSQCRRGQDTQLLVALQARFKQQGVDMRFIPIDLDPLLLLKTLGFFMILYSSKRADDIGTGPGPLLLDCRT